VTATRYIDYVDDVGEIKDKGADRRQGGLLTRGVWETYRETKVYDKPILCLFHQKAWVAERLTIAR